MQTGKAPALVATHIVVKVQCVESRWLVESTKQTSLADASLCTLSMMDVTMQSAQVPSLSSIMTLAPERLII
jgi:hypothetical protein